MNSKIIKLFLSLLLGVVFIASSTFAEEGDGKGSNQVFNKPTADPIRAYMNINFVSTIIKNDGISDINIGQDASGLIYPKGSGKTAVYTSGFLWGAIVNAPGEEDPHIGGTVYRTGLQAGWIDASGNVITDDPRVRIFRVRPDVYNNPDVSAEAQDEAKSVADVLAQYELDWQQWPGDLGAPYTDGNSNGQYDPDPSSGDIPGVPGADQTIWYVANDQEATRTSFMYGTQPMGIEMQATFWAYRQTGALGNMFFRRYVIINKSDVLGDPRTFDSMYVSMWSDPDVGDSGDDFAGCDTVLSITYAYNGSANDAVYNPLPPPAVGFDFFQGPLVDGIAGQDINGNGVDDAVDFGIFKNQVVGPGKINLPMTAAYYFINDDPTLTDPVQGSYAEGAVRFYRFLKGRIGLTGAPFTDPNTGQASTFTLPGDPVTGTGWIDGQQFAPGDRRIGAASGPFVMAPGDTQEVVVAEILGGALTGVDRLSAISLMKYYDQIAQIAYDNFFDLPTPPPAPDATAGRFDQQTQTWYAYDGEIVLDWSKDPTKVQATESSDAKGYTFQGYNVYQLPSAAASVQEGVRIATYDIIDGVGKIDDLVFDPTTGSVVTLPVQFGNDTGIKRFIRITQDALNQRPLINGIRYYFGVTAYNYNPDPQAVPNNLETPIRVLTIIPQSPDPGVSLGDDSGMELDITHVGTADGIVTATVVDPLVTTGDSYEFFFSQQQQIRNENGDWVPAATVLPKFHPNDPDTLTGSTVDISAIYAPTPGQIELSCFFNYVSSDGNWADGIEMDFPAGMEIIDFPSFEAGGGTITPVITGSPATGLHVEMGDVSGVQSTDGIFHGGETWSIYVATFTPPSDPIGWEIWDDGWSGGTVNAVGTTIVNDIGFASRTADHWNLRNTTDNTIVLENQSVFGGLDRYPPRDDLPLSAIDVGLDAMPVVDGFQVNVDVGFEAPINFFDIELTEDPEGTTTLSSSGNSDNLDIQNYTIFSGVVSSKAIDNFGVGTNELADLQQDYEYRFTGIYEETSPGIFEVTSGGQIATVFRMVSGAALADHPLNPSPGTAQPFLIRIPFEVWNVDDPENPYQVNLTFRDRERNGTERPFYAWNPVQRMYAIIVNSPYDENQVIQVDGGPDQFNDPATWVTVHYGTNYGLGAVVKITYANPIVVGTDTYSFSTTAPAYSGDLAAQQVNEINVFPNPYYGVNTEELNKYNRFVTFTHLPVQAKVRIFNLAGVLVRTIDKEDDSQFLRWDLANQDGLPVGSGLYIAYIELPELGTTKILKLAIVQEQQVLDRF